MWFDYAMSTNQRGVALVREVARYRRVAGARYLDIGCGFGGCLVAAAQAGAAECVGHGTGWSAGRICAKEHTRIFGLNASVFELDALKPDIAEHLGRFDVITCNDVAEHVESPEQLVANIRSLLSRGGVAYLEVPNGGSIEFVASDGHFGLFGITLLDREEAKKYHAEWFSFDYDVGHYLSLERYVGLFEAAGLSVDLVESLHHPTRGIGELDAQLENLERKPPDGFAAGSTLRALPGAACGRPKWFERTRVSRPVLCGHFGRLWRAQRLAGRGSNIGPQATLTYSPATSGGGSSLSALFGE